MTPLSARVGLPDVCTIERNAAGPDSWGGSEAPEWRPLSATACRAWAEAVRQVIQDGRTVVVEDRRIALPPGTDVTEQDRIASVTTGGVVRWAGPMQIQGAITHRDHVELVLTAVR